MKQFFLTIALIISTLFFTTCKKAPEVNISQFEIVREYVTPGSTTATINGVFDYGGVVDQLKVTIGKRDDFTDAHTFIAELSEKNFSVLLTDLTSSTEYKYRYEVDYGVDKDYITETRTFTTIGISLPMVSTSTVSYVGADDAICGGTVNDDGGAEITARGVCWSTNPEPTLGSAHTVDSCGLGQYASHLTGLALNTKYYVRAYATNSQGTGYGSELEFTTTALSPTVVTTRVSDIDSVSARILGEVTDNGGSEVTERGVCWSTHEEPTMQDQTMAAGSGTGIFACNLVNLSPNTTYHVRAYAKNSSGLGFGEVLTFTTNVSLQMPSVSTIEITEITASSAKCTGNVSGDGGAEITARGFCYGLTANPTLLNQSETVGGTTGSFEATLTNLQPNKTYHVRAFATNSVGTNYGEDKTFTTTEGLPTVNTGSITEITATTAKCSGEVTNQGASTVTERGVCWATTHDPTANGTHATSGSGTGSFTCNLTGLTPNAVYYVRAYAKNAQGISYGAEVSFTALEGLPVVTTGEVTDITANSAKGSGTVTEQGGSAVTERGICWSTSHNPTVTSNHQASGSGAGSFTANMTNLAAGTTYYVRAYAKNTQGTTYGEEKQFTTAASKPTVTTGSITNITQTSATGSGNVTNDGGATVTERGICWSTSQNPTISGSHQASGSGTGSFTANMTGLAAGTTYYVCAYATNSAGTSYGEQKTFSTTANMPTVTTSQVTNITQMTAQGGGNVTSDGGAAVTQRGICWSTSHNPTANGSHSNSGSGTGSFTANMTGLMANTTYYVRAFATNSQGTSYGNEVSFTTSQNISSPTVTTSAVTNITQTTAQGGGNVTNDGGASVTQRGICWGTSHNPTTSGSHAASGTGTGSYTVQMTGLTANTTYYVRAYAINSQGTSYGDEITFSTLANLPTVTTSDITNITQTTAAGGGNVTANGGATVTARGVCWSTSHNPTTSNSHTSDGTGNGSFSSSITGLTGNTTYYVRAYATNSVGTAYGSEVTFVTMQNVSLPTVTTNEITNITQTTAQGGGNVTNDGGATVTERGICWSTNQTPTISSSHASSGTGSGAFTVNMTGLTAHTTYYVRAYAINSAGTSYGSQISFTTAQNITAPTVTTSQVTNITQTSATGGGNVTSDGGANVTERGVCWSTNENPTINGTHANSGTGTGSFTVNMTNLSPGTTYFVRAYAINTQGTSYGSQISFTTSATTPTVTTTNVTNIAQTSATGGGNVTATGGASVTARGVCWSTSQNPTVSNSHSSSGTGTGSYSVDITNLNPGTTYYVRAYATNSAGTSYGTQVSFSTLATTPTVITTSVTNVSQTSATCGGNVTYDGGATVTARGVCWSTNHNPTTSDSHTSDGTGNGNFSSSITGLTANTTYYVRAYATNSAGTSYGSEVSFTTLVNVTLPSMGLTLVYDITATTAKCEGRVESTGNGIVTARGVCWSTSHNPTLNNSHTVEGSGVGVFISNITGLSTGTTYYVRTYATNSAGTAYGEEDYFTTLNQFNNGVLPGVFSVSATKRVRFSQGNLQYQASTSTWRFAENQWDKIGDANANISSTYSGWIDLFGWGTSGYNHGAVCYQPWSTSITYSDYYAYDNQNYNLFDQTGKADWGYNRISNGGNQEHQWRTLTGGLEGEWTYLLNTRSTNSGIRFVKAHVMNTNGMILVPDNWNANTYTFNNPNDLNATYNSNPVQPEDWLSILEPAGCVFLPTTGYRHGITMSSINTAGQYWSSTKVSKMEFEYYFGNTHHEYDYFRETGCAVRLVQDY